MIDESSSLRGVFLKLESKKITREEKDAEYAAIEAKLDGDGGNKLIQSLRGINVCEILARDISMGSPSVMSILSIVNRVLETNVEMVGNPHLVLRKLVTILESNLSDQKSVGLYGKALKCITLMCPTLKSLGKEGPAIKSILLRDIGNQSIDVTVKINGLYLFKALNEYKLLEGSDSNSWLSIFVNLVFDDNADLREAAIEALSALKGHISGNEEYLDTLANSLVPVKYCKMLIEMIVVDKNWAVIWRLLVELLGKRLHTNSVLVNSLLAVEEKAFKTVGTDIKKDAFNCWNSLVLNFSLEPNVLSSERRVKLLTIPLRANNCRNSDIACAKLNVWWSTVRHLRSEVMNYLDMVLQPFLNFCFGPQRESNHPSSNGQIRLNDTNTGESSAKLYPVIRVPCLHALCEILSRSADMPLPRELSKELDIPPLLAPPITSQKVFCSLSRLLTQCLGEAVMLNGSNVQQTPYIIHCWNSMLVLISRGPGEAIKSNVNDSNSKDQKTIAMVKELLRLLVNLVESSASMPEGKSFGLTILSMIECMVAGEYSLPITILNSHTYAVSVTSYLGMNSTPSLLLSVLFLSPVFSSNKELYPRVKEVFSKVLCIGINSANSPLPFTRGLLKKIDICASEQPSSLMMSYLQDIWILMASHLSDAIDKDCAISEGNDAGHDLHCIHGMLLFPLSHLIKNNLPQESLEPLVKAWKILFELYFINAQLLITTQSSDVVEELCRKIHVAFKKSVTSLNSIGNAIQFLLIMYRKPFCETYWKGHIRLSPKSDNVHGLCNSQQLLINFLYKIAMSLTSSKNLSDSEEERMSEHKSIISYLNLMFTSATTFNFSNFMLDKGMACISFYLKLTAEDKYKLDLGDEMVKLWDQFLEYMEKKALVVPGKVQSTVDALSPMFMSALKHPLTKLANLTVLHWNRSLGDLCSKVKISKALSEALDDVMKDTSGSEDIFGKLAVLNKSPRILTKCNKHESPNKSIFPVPVLKMDASHKKHNQENDVEFKIIPPKPKSPVLTEHQKEMRKERRLDIPALYQDLTQDSVSQSFSQENLMPAVTKMVTSGFVEEDANPAFPMELVAKQNFHAARKTMESKSPLTHETEKLGTLSSSSLNTMSVGDKKLLDLASPVLLKMKDDSISSLTGDLSSNDSPKNETESKSARKLRRKKQQLNALADASDSPETMNLRTSGVPNKIVENGQPSRENDEKVRRLSSSSVSSVVSDTTSSVSKDDDTPLPSYSCKDTGNHPEKNQNQSQESKICDEPLSSSTAMTEEDRDVDMTPSGSPEVSRKHLRKSIPKKLTDLQNMKKMTKRSTIENEPPSGSSSSKESPSLSSAKGPHSMKRRGRPRRKTAEGDCRSENVDSVNVPSSEGVTKESAHEPSKDSKMTKEVIGNLAGKSNECQNQNAISSPPPEATHEEHLEMTSRILPQTVEENGENVKTVSIRLEEDNDGLLDIKISSPRKLSVSEFSGSPTVKPSAYSSCNDQKETADSPISMSLCKVLPGSPRCRATGGSPGLDKWVIVTKRDPDERSPKKSSQNSSAPSDKLENVEVITVDSSSDDASDVVMLDVGVDGTKTCVSSISDDIVDSSQDPFDSSCSSVKSVTKKCAVHLPRVCDNFSNEVTLIPFEGRMLKCNLSPSKIEESKSESDLRKSVLSNSSPIVTNLFSPRNSNSRGARILSMAQGNKDRTTVEEGSGSPLGDVDSSRRSQHNSSISSLQDSPLSHYKSPDLNLTPPMKKPRRIRSLYLGNVSPQCRALEIGCMASEGEVAVHSYSPNASPGGSLMKKKRPLESDDSISPSSKKLRRVSFADPIVSRQVEFCIPDSERKFKKRAVSRCLKLPCMPKDDDDSSDIIPSQLQPIQSKGDAETVNFEDEIISSATPETVEQNIFANLNGVHDNSLTTKPALQSKLADINRITFENLKESQPGTSEHQPMSEIEKSVGDVSKNLLPTEECGNDGATDGSSVSASDGLLIEKESGKRDRSVIHETSTEIESHELALATKETENNEMVHDGHESCDVSLKSGAEFVEILPSQTGHSTQPPGQAVDSSEIIEISSKSANMEDKPSLEPPSSSEIQISPESVESSGEQLEPLSATEKQHDSSKSSESSEVSFTDSFAEEPRLDKHNTQEEVYPALRDCEDPISCVIGNLTSKIWRERVRVILQTKGINTIGDLSRLTEDFVERIPIKHNKWKTLKTALEGYHLKKSKEVKLTESSADVQVDAAENIVSGPCEMEVDDDTCGTTFREMLSKMSSKDLLKELKALNLTESLLKEIENEKGSTLSQKVPKSDEVVDELSKSPRVSGTAAPRTDTAPEKKPSEVLQSVMEGSSFNDAVSGLPLEKIIQLLKCAVSTAHKKVSTFDGSVDISARRIIQCVVNELMNEHGSVDMVKQLCWLFQNILFSKECVKSIPSLLNIVDPSVVSELILKQDNVMEHLQNQMTPAKAVNIAVDVLSQKNLSLLPEDDLNKLNDILDCSRTCEELFDRFTRIIKERLSGNPSPRPSSLSEKR